MSEYKHILVAVDGSKNANRAFSEAVDIAKRNQATLYLVAVINEEELKTSSFAYSKVFNEEKKRIEIDTLKRIQEAEERGVPEIQAIVEAGEPAEIICTMVPNSYPIDLIIVGATGKGSMTRKTIGSTTQKIMDQAPCSVLIIK